MNCYLCSANDFINRKGQVRDNPDLKIIECNCCGLVMLSSNEHIHTEHYEQSGMHGDEPISIDSWLHETAWDDERRFDMLKSVLPNKKVLDFGCGNGGFLYLAKKSGLKVISIEQYQRYPLSNHLYWLSQGKPGGHNKWGFLDSSLLQDSYSTVLAKIGKCDTIVGYFEKEN